MKPEQAPIRLNGNQAQVVAKISVTLIRDQAGQTGYLVDVQPGSPRTAGVICQALAALADYLQTLI